MQSVVREAADPLMVELTILERMGSFKRQVCLDCGQLVSGTAAMFGPMAMGATLGVRLVEHLGACPAGRPRSGGRPRRRIMALPFD
jgi:hypothetical protein